MAFLRSQRQQAAKPAPVKMVVTGLVQAWDSGDNATRLALLQNMFAELPIRQGCIIDYKPRAEVADELDELLFGFPGLPSNELLAWPVGASNP